MTRKMARPSLGVKHSLRDGLYGGSLSNAARNPARKVDLEYIQDGK